MLVVFLFFPPEFLLSETQVALLQEASPGLVVPISLNFFPRRAFGTAAAVGVRIKILLLK